MARVEIGILALIGCCAASFAVPATATEGDSFAATVHEVEAARGLSFLRPPSVERVTSEAFASARSALPHPIPIACPGPGFRLRSVETAFANLDADRVIARTDADPVDVRVALAHLLDAQHYPALARDAARRPGDAGVAERALFEASACASAQGGLGPRPEGDAGDPFAEPILEVDAPSEAVVLLGTPILVATEFLRRQPDREAPFRSPPRSTADLLIAERWEHREAPLELVGAAPSEAGCEVVLDESVGLFALIRSFLGSGGRVPRGAFAGWRADRHVALDCGGGRKPWVYVAAFDRKRDAADFHDAADSILPAEWERPFEACALGRRVIAWHDLDGTRARAFGTGLDARPLR